MHAVNMQSSARVNCKMCAGYPTLYISAVRIKIIGEVLNMKAEILVAMRVIYEICVGVFAATSDVTSPMHSVFTPPVLQV